MGKTGFLFPFIVLACVVFALENCGTAVSIISAMIFHELGHFAAIRLTGGNILSTSSSFVGAKIGYSSAGLSRRREILVYLAGPCAGATAGIIGHYLGFYDFAQLSFFMSLLNLLPAMPLDGGCILASLLPYDKSRRILIATGVCVGLVLCVLGLYCVAVGKNFTVFASGIGVFVGLVGKSSLQQGQ
ncbi:MAG: hypothetical protein J6Q16_01045 [Clostridia bacterium]|nr:hypothetical protein [Clostridia bacterium]